MRGKTIGTTLVVAALLGVGSLVAPTSVMAGHAYPADVQAARDYALKALGSTQFQCLHNIGEYESHWNPRAENKRTHAYGIPQSLPGSKMGKGWRTDPMVQVRWMIQYVSGGRYGSACNAWDHIRQTGWY